MLEATSSPSAACSTNGYRQAAFSWRYQRRRLRQHLAQRSGGSRHLNPNVPAEFERILNKALEKIRRPLPGRRGMRCRPQRLQR